MSTEENKALIRRLYDVMSERDYAAIDELVAPDTNFNGQAIGIEGYKQLVLLARTAFPDFQNTPEEYLAEGDKVVVRRKAQGTHLAPLRDLPPTGRQAIFRGFDIFRLAGGRIAESWEELDRLSMMQQLGVIPGAALAGGEAPAAAGTQPRTAGLSGSTDENRAIMRRFYEGANHGDLATIDALIAPDFAYNGQVIGVEGVGQHLATTRAAFPDLSWSIEDMIAEGDTVVTRYTYSGTQHGELMGIPPTGKTFRATGIVLDRIVDGKIAEEWETRDTLGALQQLGAIPAPQQAEG